MGLFLVLTGIYAALTGYIVYFWQNKTTLSYQLTAERLILGCALIMQLVWGIQQLFQQNSISFSMSTILLMTLWVMLLCYWIASLVYRLQGIQLFLFPTMLISLIFFYIFPGQSTEYSVENLTNLGHIIVSILAYSLLGMVTLLALLIWRLSNNLHYRKKSGLICFLQPLLRLEKYMFQLLWIGFILLTLSLFSGILVSEQIIGTSLKLTHRFIFGIISWLIFATLLFGRTKYHWRGTIATRFILSGSFFLMLIYTGTQFVLEHILNRPWSN